MALEDLLSTPSGYATPDQLASVRQYADLLLKGGQRDKPITSPWQGVRMMADTLAGKLQQNRAGQQQMVNLGLNAAQQSKVVPFGAPGQTPTDAAPTAPMPTSPTAPNTAASIRNNNPGAQWPGPTSAKFGATGSQVIGGGNKIATFDDPVKGAAAELALLDKNYAGMPLGAAVTKWSGNNDPSGYIQHIVKSTGLSPNTIISPELLRSPQGIALAKAMADWEAGGKYPLNDQQWGQAHALAFGQTADLSGRVGGVPPPTANALAAPGPQMAAGAKAAPGGAEPPMPSVGAPQFGPEYSTGRPQIDQRTLQGILASPSMDPAMKQLYYQMYLEQHLPVDVKGPGGHWIVPEGGRGKPLWVPDLQKYKEGEYEVPATADERGNMTVRPLGPGGQQTPAPPGGPPPIWNKLAPPAPTPGGPLAAPPPGPRGEATPPPGAPQVASSAPGGQPTPSMLTTAPPKPQQVASLDPSIGVPPPASKAPPTGAGVPPSSAAPASSGPLAQAPPMQMAQAQPGPAGPLGSWVDQLKQWEIGNKAQEAGSTEQAKGFAESAEKERVGLNEAATKSATGMSQLQLARNLVDDPNFQAGLLAKQRLAYTQLKAWLGKNPDAARANETFEKIIASQTLPELSAATKNMGQVRLAELQVVQNSLASRNLTPEGIKSVLEIMMRAHQLNMDVSELANSFAQGWRMGPDGKPFFSGKKGLNDYEWQPTLQKFLASNPIITPELRAAWEKNFGSNLEEMATKSAGKGQKLPPGAWVPGSPELPPGVTPDKK